MIHLRARAEMTHLSRGGACGQQGPDDLCCGSAMPNMCRNGPRPATHECCFTHVVASEELPIVPPSQGAAPPNTPLSSSSAPPTAGVRLGAFALSIDARARSRVSAWRAASYHSPVDVRYEDSPVALCG